VGLDTRNARASALSPGLVALRPLPDPDNEIDRGDRAQLGLAYRVYFQLATGTLAGTLPSLRGSFTGAGTRAGTLAATLPSLAGSFTGFMQPEGIFAGTLPSLGGSFAGFEQPQGTVAGELPSFTGAFSGTVAFVGSFAGVLPSLTGAFEGLEHPRGVVAGELPALTAAFTGHLVNTGTIVADLPSLTGAFEGGTPLIIGMGNPASGGSPRVAVPPAGVATYRQPPAGGAGMFRNVPPRGQ